MRFPTHEQLRIILMAVCASLLAEIAVSVALATFLRNRRRARMPRFDPTSGAAVLEYHWTLRLLTASLAFGSLIFPIAGLYSPPGPRGWVVLGILTAVMFGGSILLLIEFAGVRVLVGEEGVLRKSPWHRDRFMRWGEIERLTWRLANGLEMRSEGSKIIVPQHLQGIWYLYDRVRRHVSEPVYWAA